MTRAVLLALVAGPLAVVGASDLLAASRAARRRRTRRRPRGRALVLLAALGRRVGVVPAPGDLAARLAAAGSPLGLSPADLMAVKVGAAVVAALAAAPLVAAAPGRTGLFVALAGGAAGYLAPDHWLRRRRRARVSAMEGELGDVLDLLRVCVQAGLPVGRALGEVGARHKGVLAAELRAAAATIRLGTPREEALERLTAGAPLPAVIALVAAIGRSERHGAPLAPALSALAADARAEQGRALAEHAAKAAPKIQLVVALLLVPAVMLLVGAAVLRAFGLA
ncbi:MAG: type II secretion system F family protein [Solirubrobacteraceae bacterium]